MPPRIVGDTNVFIGAILSPAGENRQVLRACLLGKARPLMGAALFHEYEDLLGRSVLMAKSPLKPRDRENLFAAFLSMAENGSRCISSGGPTCLTKPIIT